MGRIIVFTGKGGVGKTSMAAATACRSAYEGKKTLVMSTDAAHSLGDSFEIKIENVPEEIFPDLFAMELDSLAESRQQWGRLHDYLKQLIQRDAETNIEAEEALIFPGMEELLALLTILDFYEKDDYDVLVVDCAPTGKTLTLLHLPEVLDRLMERLLVFVRMATKMIGPVISATTGVPKPEDKVFEEFQTMIGRLKKLQEILCNKDVTAVRIVSTPERIVMEEAMRNYTWMKTHYFNVDAVIINRIYPESALQGYFSGWTDMQKESLKQAEQCFPDANILCLKMQEKELKGREALLEAAEELYDQKAWNNSGV